MVLLVLFVLFVLLALLCQRTNPCMRDRFACAMERDLRHCAFGITFEFHIRH